MKNIIFLFAFCLISLHIKSPGQENLHLDSIQNPLADNDRKKIIHEPTRIYSAPLMNDTTLSKNNLFGTAGSVIGYGGISVNYARYISYVETIHTSLWVRLSAGKTYSLVIGGFSFQQLSVSALTGRKNNHFEAAAGLLRFHWDRFDIAPAGNLGYRYQKPEGGFIFRAGIAFPESLYISFGFSF